MDGKPSWTWVFTTDSRTRLRIEFLADDPELRRGKAGRIPRHANSRLARSHILAARFENDGDSLQDRQRRLTRQRDFAEIVNGLLEEIVRRR